MKKKMKSLISLALAFALVFNLGVFSTAAAGTSVKAVGSLLDSYAEANGKTYTLTTSSRIFVVSTSAPTGELLQTAQLIQRQLAAQGYPSSTVLEMVWGPENYAKTGDIVLKVDSSAGLSAEGYQLDVGDTAVVTANDVDGLLYGANMLMKCFNYGTSLTGFTAKDAPDTKQRIVSLDCGRKYFSAEWIKNFIRQMSWMGYNAIELHFSDDGGFRLDIWDSTYYTGDFQPKNDFSWICGSKVQYWVYDGNKNNSSYPYSTDPDAGKYLKASEIVDILKVAEEYHIDVIPSFDSPAHLDYLTWKFEQKYKSNSSYSFIYNGTTYKASSNSGCINFTNTTGASSPDYYYSAANIKDGSMGRAFLFAIYEDLANFFKEYAGSTDFSIGADEVPNPSNRVWSYSDFVDYINDLNALLKSKGYTMRMFNDYLGSTAYNYTGGTSSTTNAYAFDTDIEIMYWDSPYDQNSGSSSGTATVKASVLGKEGFTLYNCIQSNCYHVLRVANSSSVSSSYKYMDARNPDNLNWSFNYSTEEKIYTTWTPNDMGEKGKYSTTDTVSSIGGAYFLIWNDYASVSTESELWNGAKDGTGTSSNTYYMIDRMWSNIMKMWNWDVDDSVSYSNFKTVRSNFGYFPGFTSSSADAYLPAATVPTQAYLADHSALTAALATKISNDDGKYTAESYAAYENAYNAAAEVNKSIAATQEQVDAAVKALNEAKAALVEYVAVDKSDLQTAVNGAISDKGSYTDASWSAYQSALAAAEKVLNNADATQTQVDEALSSLNAAKNALEITLGTEGDIISIAKLSNTVRYGKQVSLKVVTSADVSNVAIYDGTTQKYMNVCVGKAQTLKTGDVKVWLIYFKADKQGTITYTVNVGGESAPVEVTVK